MRKLILVAVTVFLFSNEATAQQLTTQQQQSVENHYQSKEIIYFTFNVKTMQEVKDLRDVITVDMMRGAEVSAHATREQFIRFLPFNYKYTILTNGESKKTEPAKKHSDKAVVKI